MNVLSLGRDRGINDSYNISSLKRFLAFQDSNIIRLNRQYHTGVVHVVCHYNKRSTVMTGAVIDKMNVMIKG